MRQTSLATGRSKPPPDSGNQAVQNPIHLLPPTTGALGLENTIDAALVAR